MFLPVMSISLNAYENLLKFTCIEAKIQQLYRRLLEIFSHDWLDPELLL